MDTRIWLNSADNGNVVAAADDYAGSGDFDWELAEIAQSFGDGIETFCLMAVARAPTRRRRWPERARLQPTGVTLLSRLKGQEPTVASCRDAVVGALPC